MYLQPIWRSALPSPHGVRHIADAELQIGSVQIAFPAPNCYHRSAV